jgi:hypothetical protein
MKFVYIHRAIALMLFVVGVILVANDAMARNVELHEKLPNDGVMTITAGDLGEYKIDTRFNLCFLVSKSVVQIPCKPFKNLHGNE